MFPASSVFRKGHGSAALKSPKLAYLRQPLVQLVGSASRRIQFKHTFVSKARPLLPALPAAAVYADLQRGEKLLTTRCGMELFLYRCGDINTPLIQELGRLREQTFRLVGEGTGKALDVDRFDASYQHVVLWQPAQQEICGAYRLGDASQLAAKQRRAGLYCSTLFKMHDTSQPQIAQGIELGRSFIQAKYQGTRALDYLWQGIGAVFERWSHCHYAFGAVSLSAGYGAASSADIIAHYQHYYGASQPLASARHAYRPAAFSQYMARFNGADEQADLRLLKTLLQQRGQQVPVLFKQYSDLCDAGGVQFMAYSVDPAFNNCVDALVTVDINAIKAAKKARYFPNRGGLNA